MASPTNAPSPVTAGGPRPSDGAGSAAERTFAEAEAHRQAGRTEAAEALYHRVLATAPQHFGALYGLGHIAAHNRDYKSAEMWVGRALALAPDHAEAHYNLGNALREQGRLEEAAASYRHAAALAPRQPEIFVNLGVTLRAQDDLDGAVESYQRALALKPDFPDALCNLGVAYQMQGRLDQAIASFERALALRPDFPLAHTNLALALFLTGEFARAAEEYEWRWQSPGFPPLPKHEVPAWDGRPLPDSAAPRLRGRAARAPAAGPGERAPPAAVNGKMFECCASGTIDVSEAEAAALMRLGGWVRCGTGDGRPRVRSPSGEAHATFADEHFFDVRAGSELAVADEFEAAMLVHRECWRVG